MPNTVVLHQWEISPFCGKVRKALKHKGLAFSVVNYNGLLALRAAKLSPAGKLPVLELDGDFIQDSSAIVHFLEARFPMAPLIPSDPAQRALALVLEDWADESLYWYEVALRLGDPEVRPKAVELLCIGRPNWERWLVGIIAKSRYSKKLAAQGLGLLPLEQVRAQMMAHVASIDQMLAAGPWLVGGLKSIADIAVSAQIDEMVRTSSLAPRILEFSRVRDWLARCT